VVVGLCFSLMLVIGFYARLSGLEIEAQDTVVREYLLAEFSQQPWGPYVLVVIFLALLAAGMSTLDGILVALSAMVVNDLMAPYTRSHERSLVMSRWVLVVIGVAAAAIAWNPPELIGLFAQKGVYGLGAASLVPILYGTLSRETPPFWIIATAAVIGLAGHLYLNLFGGVENPAVSAAYAILLSAAFTAIALGAQRLRQPAPASRRDD
jgi:SSS family solute:Na+ symporter/sodium/pantothenate symporter